MAEVSQLSAFTVAIFRGHQHRLLVVVRYQQRQYLLTCSQFHAAYTAGSTTHLSDRLFIKPDRLAAVGNQDDVVSTIGHFCAYQVVTFV